MNSDPASGKDFNLNVFSRTIDPVYVQKLTDMLRRLQWCWIVSENENFVIGDNPVVRWSLADRNHHGLIGNAHVEVTVPISKRLAIHIIHEPHQGNYPIAVYDPGNTMIANARQFIAASERVYGRETTLTELGSRFS